MSAHRGSRSLARAILRRPYSQWTQATRRAPFLRTEAPQIACGGSRTAAQFRAQDRVSASNPAPRYASSQAGGEELMRTPLYELHEEHQAKFVPFGGFSMPVQYGAQSIVDSHAWTREHAGLFDVSHMVQHHISGSGAGDFLSRITPVDIEALPRNQSTYAVLLHRESGGIVDDTVITRLGPDQFYVVTNAACREKDGDYLATESQDFKRLQGSKGVQADFEIETRHGEGLLALQGPQAAEILGEAVTNASDLDKLYFGLCGRLRVRVPGSDEIEVLASRGGYTGEDGFELSVPAGSAAAVARTLLDLAGRDRLRLVGLGARDTLRLEAGMCLYGHDLDDTTTPIEGGLSWVVAKSRRSGDPSTGKEPGGFHAAERILAQLKSKDKGGIGVSRRRVGLVVEGVPAREGALIVGKDEDDVVGKVTSGCPSPTLGKNIAMGYVDTDRNLHKLGSQLNVVVRKKIRKAEVVKMPFVPPKYYRG